MKSLIEIAAMTMACASAAFWFASALCRMPRRKTDATDADDVAQLTARLQRMSTWNFWAAGSMGITALLSVWIRYLG